MIRTDTHRAAEISGRPFISPPIDWVDIVGKALIVFLGGVSAGLWLL